MPNWCYNKLEIQAQKEHLSELESFLEKAKIEIEDGYEKGTYDFSLSGVLPRPKVVDITTGSKTDYGKAVVLFDEYNDDSGLQKIINYPWVQEAIEKARN